MRSTADKKLPPPAGKDKRGTDGHIAYLLRQAHGAVRIRLDQVFSASGLTTPQFLVLNLLDAYPGSSGAEIARIAHLTPQTMNLVVRKLVRDELVQRSAHETHGRVLRLEVTATGKTRLAQCKRLADDLERQLLSLLDARAQGEVKRWLVAVATSLARA